MRRRWWRGRRRGCFIGCCEEVYTWPGQKSTGKASPRHGWTMSMQMVEFCGALRGQALSMLGNRPRIKTTMANAGASIRLFVKNSWMECPRRASRTGVVHARKPSTNRDGIEADYSLFSTHYPSHMLYHPSHRNERRETICLKLLMFTFPSRCTAS